MIRVRYPKKSKEVGEINLMISNKKNDRRKSESKKKKKEELFITEFERMQLKAYYYKGYREITRTGVNRALLSSKRKMSILEDLGECNFENLEYNKTYLISDLLSGRVGF